MNNPIIFIHYGDAKYLRYALSLAVKNNPRKDVVLLGDKTNKKFSSTGARHFLYEDFLDGNMYKDFKINYQYIRGELFDKTTLGKKWTNFNFKKWFALNSFIKTYSISSFWTFDSDVYILNDLLTMENKVDQFDYTTWNDLQQLQGYCNSHIIEKYCAYINQLFLDNEYLLAQQEEFIEKPNFGLTLMRVFNKFYIDGVYSTANIFAMEFDDGIFCHNFNAINSAFDQQFSSSINHANRSIKDIYISSNGKLFCYNSSRNDYVNIITLDTSWLGSHAQRSLYYKLTSDRHTSNSMKKISFKPKWRIFS